MLMTACLYACRGCPTLCVCFVGCVSVQLKEGDRVLYFKYAGDNMETPKGEKFVVLREDDVLCKA